MLIVSCALIYDDAIRACDVSTVTADRTGKFILLICSLTASHCSTEAHLAGVPFPRSFDSRLALRQSWSTRLKSIAFDLNAKKTPVTRLNKVISCQQKVDKNKNLQFCAGWPSLDQSPPLFRTRLCLMHNMLIFSVWNNQITYYFYQKWENTTHYYIPQCNAWHMKPA